jgi:NAD(P)-dependent dehydrogenase (short-subunit alcohol dehydrogenase family)
VSAHDFSGRHVVITGASRGLGRACAEAFAAAGAEVILVARVRQDLEDLAASLRARAASARPIVCDVTDDAQVAQLFGGLERCDVLVNNAGTNRPQPFLDVDLATFDEIIRLNVRSMFVVAQAAARRMAPMRTGAIVNMSSQMGHVGGSNRTVA